MSADQLAAVIERTPDIQGGAPVFRGTRVPVQSLFDHLEAGESIESFLEGFQTVRRQQVIELLELCRAEALTVAA